MDLMRLRAMLAAPVAAVFLLLVLVGFAARQRAEVGVPLWFYPKDRGSEDEIGVCNYRRLVVWLDRDGTVRINETRIPPGTLRARLAEIFEYRAFKQVFVVADSGVSWQQFLSFFSQIEGASPGLEVVLLSGELRREAERGEAYPCAMIPVPQAR
jgi:biopolymer transport protein ExbD